MRKAISWRRVRRWILKRRNEAARAGRFNALMRYLDGKSVAIVGNSSSLLTTAQGALIDSHDVIIRMNKGFPISPAAQGSHLDVWCFSNIDMARQAPAGFAAPHAVWMSPKLRHELDGSVDCCFYPILRWRRLRARLGAPPSVGAMTVDLVSCARPASVSIFGFDFKRSGTFYMASNEKGRHDYPAEAGYVTGMAQRPGWRFVAPDGPR